jgi:hypothetical protein
LTDENEIVAVVLLSDGELKKYGSDLKLVYPVPTDGSFDDLLRRLELASSRTPNAPKLTVRPPVR